MSNISVFVFFCESSTFSCSFSLSLAFALVIPRCFVNSLSLWYPQSYNFFVSTLRSVFDLLLLSHVPYLFLKLPLSFFHVVSLTLSVLGIRCLLVFLFPPSLCQ